MANYFNSEKYSDPTAYTAIKNIEKQEKLKPKSKKKQKIRSEEANCENKEITALLLADEECGSIKIP